MWNLLYTNIPYVSTLIVENIDAVLNHAETIVIGNNAPDFQTVPQHLRNAQCGVGFVPIAKRRRENSQFDGICS